MLTKKLSQKQINFYHVHGYLAVNNVISPTELDQLRRVTDEFVEKSRMVTEHTDVFDLEPGHTPESPKLRRLKNPIQHHPVYDHTIRHPNILSFVSQLIGSNIRSNGNKLNIKSAGFGSPVEWHQDWAFYPHTNDDILAVGVAIDDMTQENGCMLVVPGSHRGPIYDHNQNGVFVGAVTNKTFNMDKTVPLEVKAGGISIHHVRILHGSAPNVSRKSRRLLLFQYCAADAWPLMGFGDWDTFNGTLIQGNPTNVARMTTVPVCMPLPPARKSGSIYEIQTDLENKLFAEGN